MKLGLYQATMRLSLLPVVVGLPLICCGCAMLYEWPAQPINRQEPIFGTFGEFRGAAGDGLSTLHGATDLALGNTNDPIFSIDVGLLVRELPAVSGNPSAGIGGVRVGHFGYQHVKTVDADPGNSKLPIYVVDRDTEFFNAKASIATPTKDADFTLKKVKDLTILMHHLKLGARKARTRIKRFNIGLEFAQLVPVLVLRTYT